MITEKIVETIVLQIPAVGILLAFTVSLYRDMRNDAINAAKQREESILAIRALTEKIDELIQRYSAKQEKL